MESWFEVFPTRGLNFSPSSTTPPSSYLSPAFTIDGKDTYDRFLSTHANIHATLGGTVELVLCLVSMCMGLGIFLPSILRSHERTLRFQLIIGLSCSDFFLA